MSGQYRARRPICCYCWGKKKINTADSLVVAGRVIHEVLRWEPRCGVSATSLASGRTVVGMAVVRKQLFGKEVPVRIKVVSTHFRNQQRFSCGMARYDSCHALVPARGEQNYSVF